jgi:hypothetical protein
MTQTRHTKGQWKLFAGHGGTREPHKIYAHDHPKGFLIASLGYSELSVTDNDYLRNIQEQEANAKLIAEAPETAAERDRLKIINAELLEALEKISDNLEVAFSGNLRSDASSSLLNARTAIAKARGQS